MLPLIDFSSGLLPYMRDGSPNPLESAQSLCYLSKTYGISRFCMMPIFDCVESSVPIFLLKRTKALEQLCCNDLGVSKADLRLGATVLLRPSLWETQGLSKLTLNKPGLLPIRFPLGVYEEWMDLELNRLLYKCHYQLLFTSFEVPTLLFSQETIEKLLRIQNAVFQFNYRALARPTIRDLIKRMLQQQIPVLLGTGLNNLNEAHYYELEYYLNCAKNELTPSEFQKLLTWNQIYWKK